MKKLFALMLALCLLCGCAAMAENAIAWEDYATLLEEKGIEGSFYTFDTISAAIWIPTGFEPQELPDETYIGYFATSEGDAVAVTYVAAENMDLESYGAILEKAGATEIEFGTVNGLPCVSYELAQSDGNNSLGLAFITEAGNVFEAICAPANTEDEKFGCAAILASIQPYEQ